MTRFVSILGDSISTFEGMLPDGYNVFYQGEFIEDTGVYTVADTWWAQVIEAMGGQLLANASWSGSMVEGAGMPAGNCNERVAALARDGQVPDDVLIYFGTNDYGWGSPLFQAAARVGEVPFFLVEKGLLPEEGIAGLAPEYAAESFGIAYRCMLERIRGMYPAARIWCISLAPGRLRGCDCSTFTYNLRGVPWKAYNAAIAQAAADVNAAAEIGDGLFTDATVAKGEGPCRVLDIAALGYDYEAREGTHPTVLGMRQLAWMVCRTMGLAAAEGTEYPGGDCFRATDPCIEPGRTCVGCEFVQSTGNQWRHVCLRPVPQA